MALAMFDIAPTAAAQDPTSVLLWRLLLWEPWFLVWGVLLGLAAWHTHKRRAQV